jgi:hypothetical protein
MEPPPNGPPPCFGPPGRKGVPSGTGQKKGSARRSRKSGEGCVNVIVRRSPLARRPEMCGAPRSRKACSPAMSPTKYAPGVKSPSFFESARSIE